MELEVERAASRPALAVRIGRVESPPFSEQLRAPTGARAPRSAREARALPREIICMDPAWSLGFHHGCLAVHGKAGDALFAAAGPADHHVVHRRLGAQTDGHREFALREVALGGHHLT